MKKRNARLIFMTMFLIIMSSVSVFAAEVDTAVVNADKFGVLTLLPPVVAIILAFATKNVILSLVLGVMSGGFLLNLNGVNILSALFNSFLDLVIKDYEAFEQYMDETNKTINELTNKVKLLDSQLSEAENEKAALKSRLAGISTNQDASLNNLELLKRISALEKALNNAAINPNTVE